MVQIYDAPPSGLSRFAQKISPGVDNIVERFIEKKAAEKKEKQQREISKALGLGDLPLDSSTINQLLRDHAKEQKNNKLLQTLGIVPPTANPFDSFLEDEEEGSNFLSNLNFERSDFGEDYERSNQAHKYAPRVRDPDEIPASNFGSSSAPASAPASTSSPNLTDEQILGLSLVNAPAANIVQKQKEGKAKVSAAQSKEERRQFEADRTYHTNLTKKARDKVEALSESIPKKESALRLSRDAVETGDLGFFSRDNLANATGIDYLRTAKGAQLTTAMKENLLSNMSRVSAKGQNQWFEQRLISMAPQIGQTLEANLTTQTMIEGELAMDKAYLDTFEKLADEDREKYGYIKEDIEQRTRKETDPINKKIMDLTSYELRQIYEEELGPSKLRKKASETVAHGTPLTLEMAEILVEKYGKMAEKKALELGYTLPDEEIYMEFAQ